MKISEIKSAEIRAQAKRYGIKHVTLIGTNGKQGDACVDVYDFGGVRVAATNGNPIWEESDPTGFAALMESEGIAIKSSAAVTLGKLGGKVKSPAKSASSRANGALGGRPRKYAHISVTLTTQNDGQWGDASDAEVERLTELQAEALRALLPGVTVHTVSGCVPTSQKIRSDDESDVDPLREDIEDALRRSDEWALERLTR